MRISFVAVLALALAACVTTPPATVEQQAAYWGPVPDAPTPEQIAQAEPLTDYVWVQRPDGRDYVMMYPRDAWEKEAQSNVTLDCLVLTGGRLACAARDDRTRYDFEEAARRISTRFRLDTPGRDVESAVGQSVVVRMWFRIAG